MQSSVARWGVGEWVVLFCLQATTWGGVFYVDSDAPEGGDGKSWAGAYTDLNRALDEAISDDEIRVAGGVYRPGPVGGNRELSFFIDTSITLLGGYAGAGQPDPDARDIAAYPTILSGDLNGDDAVVLGLEDLPGEPTRQDNVYHVVKFGQNSERSVLEGFIITGGNANGSEWYNSEGGGISGWDYYFSPPLFRFCTIEFNSSGQSSGGAYVQGRFEDCVVRFNYAVNYGGGLGSVREITRCVIEDNGCGQYGGGLNLWSARVVDSVIRKNTAAYGGGIYAGPAGIEMTGCTIENNHASVDGGGIYVSNCGTCNGFPVLYRCRIIGNTAGGNGGGFYEDPSEGWLWSCLIAGNTAGGMGGGIYEGSDGYCGIVNCTVFTNTANDGGGMLYLNAYSTIEGIVRNCIFWGNTDLTGTGTEPAQIHLVGQYSTGHVPDDGPLSALAYHCCIQGLTNSYTGSGNISSDPHFVDGYGQDDQPGTDDDDLRLLEDSPCINAGDNGMYSCEMIIPGTLPGTGTGTSNGTFPGEEGYSMCGRALFDLDTRARIRNGIVDMGAYEQKSPGGNIIYVDDSAPGANDGTCWGDAFIDLQDALAVAIPGQEIRVAQGVYRPADPNGSRESAFVLKGGVVMLGGFAGFRADDPDARDIRAYETILSGDLSGDDYIFSGDDDHGPWHDCSREDNSENVVLASGLQSGTVLEGFTILGGQGGGGLRCHAAVGLEVRDCLFRENLASAGGGLHISDSTNCHATNCVFTDNYATGNGGGIYLHGQSLTVDHCLIVGNQAEYGGGMYLDNVAATIVNGTVAHNFAWDQWGGVAVEVGDDVVGELRTGHFLSCIFWGNTSENDNVETSQIGRNFGNATFDFCCVQGWTGKFAGVGTIDQDPLFVHPGHWDTNGTFYYYDDVWIPGDYHLQSQSGRWDAALGGWVQDGVTSPCIDAGDPMAPIMYEPFPSGGVINMGAYGGTAEASKSWFGGPICEAIVAGDINGDCKVNLADFAILSQHWLWDGQQTP
ncbi:MAG: hypothetical protein GX455_12725 [Phycisphaerae bacterium]|nr:hypothetical protein [Phycisphaerae bacterium]